MQHFIGSDLHTRDQVVAWIEEQTGEIKKRRLEHEGKEVKEFYAQFPRGTVVGIEATFPAHWFERLLGELGHELWVGDAARIRASEVRYQKTDARDAELLLDLLRTGRFPRIWVPSLEERDLRQLLVHRMKQVRARTQVKNQLHALAISQGVCRKSKLWSVKGRKELESLALLPWAARRRKELLESLDRLDEQVRELDRAVEEAGRERPDVALLRTHPGVGMVVGLAFVLSVGPIERFPNSRKLVSYWGLNPREASSGGRQRLGSISKQGNTNDALAADRGRANGGAPGSAVAPYLSTLEETEDERGGESRRGPPPGSSVVLDAAHAPQLRAARSHVRQPE